MQRSSTEFSAAWTTSTACAVSNAAARRRHEPEFVARSNRKDAKGAKTSLRRNAETSHIATPQPRRHKDTKTSRRFSRRCVFQGQAGSPPLQGVERYCSGKLPACHDCLPVGRSPPRQSECAPASFARFQVRCYVDHPRSGKPGPASRFQKRGTELGSLIGSPREDACSDFIW